MDPADAVSRVLSEHGGPMHWTAIQDAALREGYLDPFTLPDVRREVLRALAHLIEVGIIERVSMGVYALVVDAPGP